MRQVGFHPEALAELRAAVEFYEGERRGLGRELALEVRAVLDRLAEWPGSGVTEDPEVRRALLARFPFTIVYRLVGDAIEVVAVMHQRQRPGYWRRRPARI